MQARTHFFLNFFVSCLPAVLFFDFFAIFSCIYQIFFVPLSHLLDEKGMTYYDYVNNQVEAGLWEQTQFMFGRNATALDFYYRIYNLVLKFYPERRKGYAVQFVHSEEIMRLIGGGIRRI